MEWEPRPDQQWLKAVGAADWPMDDTWFDEVPNERTIIRFSNRRPASIRVGDALVYYATGYQVIFGIVEVFSKPRYDPEGGRWPWFADVREKVIIKDLSRAPGIDVLSEADDKKDWRKYVQQMDYHQISGDVFAHIAATLVRTGARDLGDVIEPSFAQEYGR